ncbi:MAG: hypothetical protein U0989_06870, partial [Azonexus sp.]|nr:hypothetical protein [Azonexus sp.]
MSCNKQSSNKQPSNNGLSAAGDLSSATLTSIGELVKALEHQGKTVTILEKAGGGIGTGLSVADVLAKMASGDGNGAFVSASGVVLGMAVGAAAAAAAVAFLPAAGVGAAAIFVIGAVGAYIGNEAGKKLGDFLADPTLEPAFYEATLSIREFELRGMGRDPNSDPGVQNMRRQLEKSRRLAGIPSPSDCPIKNIKKKAQIASTYPSPIILDLDGDGVIDTVDLGAGVYFDHAADGFAERTGWVAPGDGLLVWDRNANGTIDTGRELFGSETPLHLAWKAV